MLGRRLALSARRFSSTLVLPRSGSNNNSHNNHAKNAFVKVSSSHARYSFLPLAFAGAALIAYEMRRSDLSTRFALSDASNPNVIGYVSQKLRDQREASEKALRLLAEQTSKKADDLRRTLGAGGINPREYEKALHDLKHSSVAEAERLVFGPKTQAGARQAFLDAYGCVKCTDQAVAKIKQYAPKSGVVEIGAGVGHWEKGLRDAGVDVIAYDDVRALPTLRIVGKVQFGDFRDVAKHADRALLLVYPPPGEMAANSVRLFKGDTIIFVGEGRGGANGSESFFKLLEDRFKVVDCLDPASSKKISPMGFDGSTEEKLWVLKRLVKVV